ncbi:hypothetical protein SAMN04488693_13411 [Arthrobacter subterraneus]|uniref:Uncharacterized protein n=1 Tax=Arthrobacter subterraneus TaxID=335973 RepID=A0A1G8PIJ2_9MICC|nr:hypothetical protein [Arthrobacter subterraneus]SDI92252.1 hypothetical protein SAMN04488693_13411 [Arthrobacter subterraneus]
MTTQPTRRTLTGLTPKATKVAGVDRLIKANRPAPVQREDTSKSLPASEREGIASPPESLTASDSVTTDSVSLAVPKYLQLQRREARIHVEQADALTMLTRRLNSERRLPNGSTVGERITDNTLIRVAIDLLLQRENEIRGASEEAIAQGLGLEPRRIGR